MTALETMDVADDQLVASSLAGDREAFGQIVARYQTLVCSLAYARTGRVAQSEDLAQETFVTAWRELPKLREPGKLRSWLCTIARNLIYDALRDERREPSHAGETLESLEDSAEAPDRLPSELAINKEEEAILWRAVEQVPEIYRESLVLFYREHRSIEAVAASLELSEDAVKQRLSRGRKLLQEQVLAFVEGALERTNPGKAFTVAVLASLPALGISANAATATLATVKGGAALKSAGAAGVLGMVMSPLMILFGNMIPYRMAMAEARSDEERQRVRALFGKVLAISISATAVVLGLFWFFYARHFSTAPSAAQMVLCGFVSLVVSYVLALFGALLVTMPSQRRHSRRVLEETYGGKFPPAACEYRSAATFLGLPLVHVRIGDRFSFMRPPVKAWIAVGDFAIGGLVAFGSLAVAPFSIGGVAFGFFSLGGVVAGMFPMGALAFGAWAFGGVAVGYQACGAVAVAWNAAAASVSFAHEFGIGNIVAAAQANTESARAVIAQAPFFRVMDVVNRHYFWVNLLWILPLLIQWQIISRKRRAA